MYMFGRGLLTVVAAAAASLLMLSAPAAAHPEQEVEEAKVLVQQAIALIVNAPDDRAEIETHIHFALEAPDQTGVDMDLLEQAAAAFEEPDLARTRELLQASIGARPVTDDRPPRTIRETPEDPAQEVSGQDDTAQPGFAVGAETGTTVMLDPYHPSASVTGEGAALLALSVIAILAGGFLAWRGRPQDSVRQLRRATASESEA